MKMNTEGDTNGNMDDIMQKQINEWFDKEDRVLPILKELIRFRSVNPPGNEHSLAVFICEWLADRGFDVTVQRVEEGRSNIIANFGCSGHIGMILNGHLDVVPAAGEWRYPPFEATLENGKIYGRGTADMKGGIAAMMAAAEFISTFRLAGSKKLSLVFVCDEESGNKGMRRYVADRITADAAIIGEPTQLEIHTGHRGFMNIKITAYGISCHSSHPENGINAIYIMSDIIQNLKKYQEHLKSRKDKYLGNATISVGTIKGGIKVNIVPDECTIEMERRLLPGETREEIINELKTWINCSEEVIEIETLPELKASGSKPDSVLVRDLSLLIQKSFGKAPMVKAFPAGCEASFFTEELNIPAVIFGPGSLEQAHRSDEWVCEKQLRKAAKIYSGISLKYTK
ncbi:M20 family peptidase [Biomaibacter acetigenes]|uniref:Probable succinyl-diaminopimelate desuccinylase n=1 Tax=Biomaibacter acetigenes TaxID=2316383 RepID=A0A3G2R1J0_9FIRM|nr:M20 family metallopeptidase [Biomaibacter acetigenes]AYO29209.1 M20 family peptidase [Biomaibacter acetigenes]